MKVILFGISAIWLSVAIGGVVYLARYENTPSESAVSYPAAYPSTSRIDRDAEMSTLLFFAHPKCPCTRASLRELARLMADLDGRMQAFVVISKPPGSDEDWTNTELRTNAEAIPNVHVLIDLDNRETDLFGARTSGVTLLYDRRGELRFNGGITAARAHEGDNAGSRAIFDIVTNDADQRAAGPVFGCPIHDKNCTGELISTDPAAMSDHISDQSK
jgi:hypothetical protein